MRTVFTLTTPLVLFFTIHATAQQREIKPAEERAAKLTEWMKTNLQLTEDQLPKVQEINLKYAKMNDELKAGSASRRQKLSKFRDSDSQRDAEMKAVLNNSQYQIYEAKKDEIKKRLREEVKARRGLN